MNVVPEFMVMRHSFHTMTQMSQPQATEWLVTYMKIAGVWISVAWEPAP